MTEREKKPPRFCTYNEWVKRYPKVLEDEVECDECSGTGERVCPDCDSTVTCKYCGGSGKEWTAKQEYDMRVKRDKVLWEKWNL